MVQWGLHCALLKCIFTKLCDSTSLFSFHVAYASHEANSIQSGRARKTKVKTAVKVAASRALVVFFGKHDACLEARAYLNVHVISSWVFLGVNERHMSAGPGGVRCRSYREGCAADPTEYGEDHHPGSVCCTHVPPPERMCGVTQAQTKSTRERHSSSVHTLNEGAVHAHLQHAAGARHACGALKVR